MKRGDAEHNIGIELFFTKTKGIGGKLRTLPEDFIVHEHIQPRSHKEQGSYVVAEVFSKNWETNLLVREFANRLHISRKRISFAGTKDKRACTTQRMSFASVTKEALAQIQIKDVTIKNSYYADKPISLGDLSGNSFEIIIRNLRDDINPEQINPIITPITTAGGYPNFFGVQRFGVIRPVNHLIGRHIVHGDFEKAVMTYIAHPIQGEDPDHYRYRNELQNTYDFHKALKTYPNVLSFEKAILNKLVEHPNDFIAALHALPRNLLTMFVYAYQSYMFNRIVSERIRRKLPINIAVEHDVVLPLRNNRIDDHGIRVTSSNIDKINRQIQKGNALVSGMLFGSDSQFTEGPMGDIEQRIINAEQLEANDFIIPDIPFLSSSGSRRSVLAPVKTIDWLLIKDELHENKRALQINFSLRKGCYATSLLREIMKAKNLHDY